MTPGKKFRPPLDFSPLPAYNGITWRNRFATEKAKRALYWERGFCDDQNHWIFRLRQHGRCHRPGGVQGRRPAERLSGQPDGLQSRKTGRGAGLQYHHQRGGGGPVRPDLPGCQAPDDGIPAGPAQVQPERAARPLHPLQHGGRPFHCPHPGDGRRRLPRHPHHAQHPRHGGGRHDPVLLLQRDR